MSMKQMPNQIQWPLTALGLAVLLCSRGWAQTIPVDLTQASLEDLANLQVTSVSKKEQALSKAAIDQHQHFVQIPVVESPDTDGPAIRI
jgi:hypothetical protein